MTQAEALERMRNPPPYDPEAQKVADARRKRERLLERLRDRQDWLRKLSNMSNRELLEELPFDVDEELYKELMFRFEAFGAIEEKECTNAR